MSEIINGNLTIHEAMSKILKNSFVIPAFQRSYVWNTNQIACLWDSILSDYPISTFLFWEISRDNISSSTSFFQFIKKAQFRSGKNQSEHDNDAEDTEWQSAANLECAVLDGQQRLTSLFVTLYGTSLLIKGRKTKYAGEEISLCIQLDKSAIRDRDDNSIQTQYDIAFYESCNQSSTLFNIKRILSPEFKDSSTRTAEIDHTLRSIPPESRDYAKNILERLCQKIYEEKILQYQKISGTEGDALDMFVRFNNGGTRLSKSEIGEATIEAFWKDAKYSLSQVCYYKKHGSYKSYLDNTLAAYQDFGLDFIIRLSTVLFEKNINTNLNPKLIGQMKLNWEKIKDALRKTVEFIKSIRKLRVEDFSNRWNILIPIVYLIYHHQLPPNGTEKLEYSNKYLSCIKAVEAYLSRAILFKFYSSGTTGKLTKLKNEMDRYKKDGYPCLTFDSLNNISELKVSDEKIEDLLNLKKGDAICEMALRLISSERIYAELDENSEIDHDVDHIHPRTRFHAGQRPDEISLESWIEWKDLCEKMPNLTMLECSENREVKNDLPLAEYVNGKSPAAQMRYKNEHLIPDTDLQLNNFQAFFNQRKETLRAELISLLHKDDTNDSDGTDSEPPSYSPTRDHHALDNLKDMSDEDVQKFGDLTHIDEEVEAYINAGKENSGHENDWVETFLEDFCTDNPVSTLAHEDRTRIFEVRSQTKSYGTFTDSRDNNQYRTIKIGNQVWMAENLRFESDNSFLYDNKYGRLYPVPDNIMAIPRGWRLPTQADFEELLTYVGGSIDRLKKIKEWKEGESPYVSDDKESGFDMLPGGLSDSLEEIQKVQTDAFFWLSGEGLDEDGKSQFMYLHVFRSGYNFVASKATILEGYSIRCIKI